MNTVIVLIGIGALNLILSGTWLGSIMIDYYTDSTPVWQQYVWCILCLAAGFAALYCGVDRAMNI